ncbi:LysM domain receptor-like kinase 3 [Tanacetum coccineum]
MKHSFYCTSYTSLLANNLYGFSRSGFSGFCCFHLIFESPAAPSNEYPFTCSKQSKPCKSILYLNNDLPETNISLLYSVDISQIQTVGLGANQDYLVTVPCSCHNVNNEFAYFYETLYLVKNNDTFFDVSNEYYSGQAWPTGDERFQPNRSATIHLLCGCTETDSQVMVTYTVQQQDTLSDIANRLSAEVDEIQSVNKALIQKPRSINSCWVLFIPMYKNGLPELTSQTIKKGITGFDTERPLVYDLDEIAEATNNFDDTRIIGEGGYGSVYFGILGEKEVAIKKMRSNKSKEFLAELKVLCKIHHINVVELLGFASGDDHLYLVYEFVSNGSLNEHLHDPLLKGHQPLSWTARAQIALDAAKGIEYIHDHTKERYVHRDIKTSNILLDKGLRAKILVWQNLSVKELHVTTKTDVFAFGVVLAELITGKRALMRDNREPSKMKSLITIITKVFEEEEDPEGALVSVRDGSLRDGYPMDDLYKMAEISYWCLSEDPNNRPEIREVVESLARIVISSVEWEASLGGRSGYQQKDRKPSQNDKTEHGMEKTVQNQGQNPKMPKSESILKNQQSNRSRN